MKGKQSEQNLQILLESLLGQLLGCIHAKDVNTDASEGTSPAVGEEQFLVLRRRQTTWRSTT